MLQILSDTNRRVGWEQLREELGDRFVAGPLFINDGDCGHLSPNLQRSGFRIQLATSEAQMDASILRYTGRSWFVRAPLYLLRDDVPFSCFGPYQQREPIDLYDVIGLMSFLDIVYAHSKSFPPIIPLLREYLLIQHGRILVNKKNSEWLKPEIAESDFTVADLRRRKSGGVVARITWAGMHAGSIEFHPRADGTFEKPRRISQGYRRFPTDPLSKELASLVKGNLNNVLSASGETAIRNCHGQMPHPRTLKAQERKIFVHSHPEFWDSPRKLAEAMISAGLYSVTYGKGNIEQVWERELVELREQASSAK